MTDEDLKKIGKVLDDKLADTEKRIIGDIGKFMVDNLLPVIDDKADKSDLDRIERKLDIFGDKASQHDMRLRDIESIPVIAHELKIKRH